MTNPQGTIWESDIVTYARKLDMKADRLPKRGQAGEPDLWVGSHDFADAIPVVMWKRLVGTKADGRRKPDGMRAVAVLPVDDLLLMVRELNHLRNNLGSGPVVTLMVQAKWTAALNVTRCLGLLHSWLKTAKLKLL